MEDALVTLRYREYKQIQAQKQQEQNQLEQAHLKLQTEAKAKVEAARLNEIHMAQQDYLCDKCGSKIPKGTRYRRQKIPIGYGFPEGTHYTQRITHLVCVTEAKT